MSSFDEFKNWFASLDKETDEFQQVFELVNNSYWDIPEEKMDDYVKAAKFVNLISTNSPFEMMVTIGIIAEEVHKVLNLKVPAAHAALKPSKDHPMILFDLYTDKKQLEAVHMMLKNTVMMGAKPHGG